MASAPIPNPGGWLGILNKLGIPRFGTWSLLDTVQPVAVVDSEISLTAVVQSSVFGTPASAGEQTAPAANTRLADTGQLAAGNWNVYVSFAAGEANAFRLRRRNAADAADVWALRVQYAAGSQFQYGPLRFSVANNERLVVENVAVGGAGQVYQALIFATQT